MAFLHALVRRSRPAARWMASRHATLVAATLAVTALAIAIPARAHPHVWVTFETTVVYENGAIVGLRQKWTFDELYTTMAVEGLDTNKDGVYDRKELAELAQVNIDGVKEFGYFTSVRLAGQILPVKAPTEYWLEHVTPSGPPPVNRKAATDRAAPEKATSEKATSEKATSEKGKAGGSTASPGVMSRMWGWLAGSGSDSTSGRRAEPAKLLSLNFYLPLEQPVLADAEGFAFTVRDPNLFIAFEPAKVDAVRLAAGAPPGCEAILQSDEGDDGRRLGDAFAGAARDLNMQFVTSKSVVVRCKVSP